MRYYLFSAITLIVLALVSCQEAPQKIEGKNTINSTETIQKSQNSKNILFFGNSITAAYGLDPKEAFSSLIQLKIDSLGLNYTCINAGNSGETTKGGLQRIDWVLKQPVSIFILELGANDGLRGYEVEETKQNLKKIIQKFRDKNPDSHVLLADMKVPPSMGEDYFNAFEKIYPEIAQEENVNLIPFILQNVAGIDSLNLPDGIHPTSEGHKIVTETIWKELFPLL
ncbi:MAG: arylesterase [Salibacteraceae bacterium]